MKQINRNIELVRYRKYGEDLLLFELVNANAVTNTKIDEGHKTSRGGDTKTVSYYIGRGRRRLKRQIF